MTPFAIFDVGYTLQLGVYSLRGIDNEWRAIAPYVVPTGLYS